MAAALITAGVIAIAVPACQLLASASRPFLFPELVLLAGAIILILGIRHH